MPDIYKTFCDYIKENNIISENDHIIIGLSGGADSMCLAVLLNKLKDNMEIRLTAVHVNHQLRGLEADADEKFVKDFCAGAGLPCIAVSAGVRSYAFEHGISLEEAGRIARYQTFFQVAKKISGQGDVQPNIKAAVAHHMDDNAETILMNMIRGAGTRGMQGMQPVSERFGLTIIRPLLCLGRNEIEAFLRQENIDYRTDSTNNEDEFARNKVRLHIIPELQQINSRASQHINEAARAIVDAQAFIEEEALKACQLMVDRRQDGFYIDLDRFGPLNTALQEQIVRNCLEKLGGSLKDIGRVHIENVLALQGKQTGRRIELPYGILAQRSYSNIILRNATKADVLAMDMTDYAKNGTIKALQERREEMQDGIFPEARERDAEIMTDPEAFVIDPGSIGYDPVRYRLWPDMEIELCLVHVNPVTRQMLTAKNEYTKAFDCAKIKGNLYVRKPEPADEIQFFGGRKSIRKFFVDEKIPQEERKRALLLSDDDKVMWIIGYRMSEAYKISEMTNLALQVTIMGGRYEQY